jgi:hypothetical protein
MKKHILFLSLFCLACLVWQCKDKIETSPAPTISSIGAGASGAKALPRQIFKIAGANLEGAKVFFKNASGADVQATIHSNTATEIYAFVPETAVTGQVRVETANGQVSSPSNFIVRTMTVSTFVGVGTNTAANGTGTAAGLGNVSELCLHPNGNLYAYHAGVIRKITPAGVVTTVAGAHYFSGNTNGTGTAARFSYTCYLAVDANENLYVADRDNHIIRKITNTGVVTTLAGSGTQGNVNGTGTAASFNFPAKLALVGNFLYVMDTNNNAIRKVDVTTGAVTTFVTPALGTNGAAPYYIDVDADGTFYGASINGAIRTISATGTVNDNSLAGFFGTNSQGYQDGFPATTAKFDYIGGIAVIKSGAMKGGVFLTEDENNHIRLVFEGVSTIAGELPTNEMGGYVDGTGVTAKFRSLKGIVCDATGNTIYVADRLNNRIRKIVISD